MTEGLFDNSIARSLFGIWLATLIAFALLWGAVTTLNASDKASAQVASQGGGALYLPIVTGGRSPAGSYYCLEYEFGLIWASEAITLNPDGSSLYVYDPPYAAIVTGTWRYAPLLQEVEFTNFRWLTATYEAPDRLWASRYLAQVGFEIAISCQRQ